MDESPPSIKSHHHHHHQQQQHYQLPSWIILEGKMKFSFVRERVERECSVRVCGERESGERSLLQTHMHVLPASPVMVMSKLGLVLLLLVTHLYHLSLLYDVLSLLVFLRLFESLLILPPKDLLTTGAEDVGYSVQTSDQKPGFPRNKRRRRRKNLSAGKWWWWWCGFRSEGGRETNLSSFGPRVTLTTLLKRYARPWRPWNALETISSWSLVWHLQLLQLYIRGPLRYCLNRRPMM